MSYDKKFLALGGSIPPPPAPAVGCNYINYRLVGNLLTLAGNGPFWGSVFAPNCVGKLGGDLTIGQGYMAARITGMNLLQVVRQALKTLDKVDYIVSVDGLVNCTPDFEQQGDVINGCSDFLVEIFGENGKHTRTASGTNALYMNIACEISMTLKIK